MGILNATPDSFHVASRVSVSEALKLGLEMESAGASILDVGGESSRPGSAYVETDEEIRRVVPTIKTLRNGGCRLPISVDTRKKAVAEAAHRAGADWVNDISALVDDPEMGSFVAETQMTVVLMHRSGHPSTMQQSPHYNDVVGEVEDFLIKRIKGALSYGISPLKIVLDPGIGFGKTLNHNLTILAALPRFQKLGFPLLVGLSRKSMIGQLTQSGDRLAGSLGGALACAQAGVAYIRVHDVEATVEALSVYTAIGLGRSFRGLDF